MRQTILTINDLEKTYRTKTTSYPVLKKINATVAQGEFVAVMGPSGSGKTTLLNIVSGFLSEDGGEVLVNGKNILTMDKDTLASIRQTEIGFVFQDFMLIDGLTVRENIYLPQIIARRDIAEMEDATSRLMTNFGINELADKYPSEISGGQKQRTAIARALSNNPALILADEPTGNLDSKSSEAVIDAFLLAKQTLNATVMMVTHDAVAASGADRILVLLDGQVTHELIKEGPRRKFMDEILACMTEIGGGEIEAK